VCGPIGAGKTSILLAIRSCTQYDPRVLVYEEDTDEWQYYLERFYADPASYAFLFQKEVEVHMHKLTKRLEQLSDECTANPAKTIVVFVERSPLDVLEVFLPLNRTRMSLGDYQCLKHAMGIYASRQVWIAANYFIVACPLSTCMERIGRRDRKGEENIDSSYNANVIQLYDEMALKANARIIHNFGRSDALLSAVTMLTSCLLENRASLPV
jgi:deoxyadenosine/deoxycytidine kinase